MHNLPNKMLKLSKDVIENSLSDLFNVCIDTSLFQVISKWQVLLLFLNLMTEKMYITIDLFLCYLQLQGYLKDWFMNNYTITSNKLRSNEQWGFRSIRFTALALSYCSYTWTVTVDR